MIPFCWELREQIGGKADDYVETIREVCGEQLLSRVKNTMTDRCVTNDSVDRKLQEAIGSQHLNSFRCSMHPLDAFYHACEKAIRSEEKNKEEQKTNQQMPFKKGSESNTHALLRAVDKLFHDLGCGCGKDLSEFLRSKGFNNTDEIHDKTAAYFRFVGNRFNIYFIDAMLAFSYSNAIQEFFLKVHHPSNFLQIAVSNGFKEGSCNTPMRALGLIGRFVTGPWMRLVGQDLNILDINKYYNEALTNITRWKCQPSEMISSKSCIFEAIPLKEDEHLHQLLQFTSNDDERATESLLQKLLEAIEEVILRQLHTQLPGGVFWDPSPRLQEEARSSTSHNISGERKFAMVDAHIRRAPNATMGKIEAKTMFRCNKTSTWLNTQSRAKKKKNIIEAITLGRKVRAANRSREITRRRRLKERLELMRKQLTEREERIRVRQEHLIEDVLESGGIWMTEQDMENNTKHMGKVKLFAALKAQINIRIKVLKSKSKKVIFTKSSINQLKECLLEVITDPIDDDKQELYAMLQRPDDLVGRRVSQKWSDDSGDEMWWAGIIVDKTEGEFRLEYEGDDKPYFMTPEEVLSDIVSGEINLLS